MRDSERSRGVERKVELESLNAHHGPRADPLGSSCVSLGRPFAIAVEQVGSVEMSEGGMMLSGTSGSILCTAPR